jgi:hypothetical protein
MDTRPKRGHPVEPKSFCDNPGIELPGTPCPRQRFFAEARKRDDGDAKRIAEER